MADRHQLIRDASCWAVTLSVGLALSTTTSEAQPPRRGPPPGPRWRKGRRWAGVPAVIAGGAHTAADAAGGKARRIPTATARFRRLAHFASGRWLSLAALCAPLPSRSHVVRGCRALSFGGRCQLSNAKSRPTIIKSALSRARPCRALLQQTEAVSPDRHPYDKPRVNLCNPMRHAFACRWVGNRLANGDRIDDRLDPTRHPWLAKHE